MPGFEAEASRNIKILEKTVSWATSPAPQLMPRKWRGLPQWQRAAEEEEAILEDREETFAAPELPQAPSRVGG